MKKVTLISATFLCTAMFSFGQWTNTGLSGPKSNLGSACQGKKAWFSGNRKSSSVISKVEVNNPAQGQIIHVPVDYPTIQQGIDAANPGDTVLVADGIYYERINFLGKKPLTVTSEFLMDGDTSHIGNTIIDGSQLDPDTSTVVSFITGEDTTSVLCGFTIQNGKGSFFVFTGFSVRAAGGIFLDHSGARIIHNHITGNHLNDTTTIVTGAGISNSGYEDDHWIVIEHNVIDHNSCEASRDQASGAGMDIYCNSRIIDNDVSWNTITGTANASSVGAGVCCATFQGWTTPITAIVKNNTITNNLSQAANNYASGAGALFQMVKAIFEDNEVTDNEVITWGSSGGATGVYHYGPSAGTVIRNNTFKGNISDLWTGALHIESASNDPNLPTVLVENNYFLDNEAVKGGAFYANSPVILQNNVFSGNHATQNGGAIYLSRSFPLNVPNLAIIINTSFSGNMSDIVGGAIYSVQAKPLIFNSIFWNDSCSVQDGYEIYMNFPLDTTEIAFTNINGGKIHGNWINGGGHLDQDPLFIDPVLLTTPAAGPSFNTGTEQYTDSHGITHACPLYDITWMTRPLYGAVDMGAYEALFVGFQDPALPHPTWHSSYPNPFSETTTISYTLDQTSKVCIKIYNSHIQLVAEPVNAVQLKGVQKVTWNAESLPAGVYFYSIQAGTLTGSGKIILMR